MASESRCEGPTTSLPHSPTSSYPITRAPSTCSVRPLIGHTSPSHSLPSGTFSRISSPGGPQLSLIWDLAIFPGGGAALICRVVDLWSPFPLLWASHPCPLVSLPGPSSVGTDLGGVGPLLGHCASTLIFTSPPSLPRDDGGTAGPLCAHRQA